MKKYCIRLLLLDAVCLLLFVGIRLYRDGLQQKSLAGSGSVASSDKEDDVTVPQQKTAAEDKPRIAITFDDGPNKTWTPKLLDGLEKRGVKASFFVIGEKAKAYPELIKRMFEDGNVVGNHTFSHVQLTKLSDAEACAEITKTNEVLKSITGVYPQYIRPPFGSWNENLECGITMFPVMWTIDTLDWTTDNTDRIVNKAVSQAKDNSIILLHDNYESSVNAALRIIDELQEKGFEFVTVEELLLE